MRTGKGRIGLSFSPEISSIARVQKEYLDGRSALLEYSVGEDRSYLLFITSSDAQLFELPGRSVLEDSLKGYLKSLSFPSHGPFMGAAASERISRALIFPLQCASQKNVDTLIIVPDGILHFLPFETLKVISEGKATYLIEKYKVSYCLSATSLSILRQKTSDRTVTKYLLAFGAPVIQETNAPSDDREKSRTEIWREIYTRDGFSFSSLPFSKKEVNTISRYFPEERRDIFIEKGASEAALKNLPLGEYEIIHFACHGFLDKRYCFRSALVLSPDAQQDEDGFLQAREIYGLRMDAKLVVLSACQSGNGALENGEGLVGLTRTFFYAGAHSVLSSIWSVNDESTAGLMDNFYASLVQGLNTSGALREAKLQMLNSTRSHPFYWAGFLLNGDAAQIQFRGLKAQKVN
jgi:CHAT domain-containing protein